MENVGQLFKDGIKKVSEAAMDAMVQSLIANQEQHLQHLQDMQKWGIVKVFQRFTSARFLHRHPCVVAAPEYSLLDFLRSTPATAGTDVSTKEEYGKGALQRRASASSRRRGEPLSPPPVGELGVTIHLAKLLLLGNNLTQHDATMRQFEWKVIVRYGKRSAETDSTVMSKETQAASWHWLSESARQPDADIPLHEAHWNTSVMLGDVCDLWGDICMDVVWRRVATTATTVTAAGNGSSKLTKKTTGTSGGLAAAVGLPFGGQSFTTLRTEASGSDDSGDERRRGCRTGQQRKGGAAGNASGGQADGDATSFGGPMSAKPIPVAQQLPDVSPCRRRPPGTEWQLYGRAIVPLSSVIYCYGTPPYTPASPSPHRPASWTDNMIKNPILARHLPSLAAICGLPESPSRWPARFWLHLFPHVSDELKFYRPVAGYPGFGMTNPQTTLGFLHVDVHFKFTVPPLLASLVSVVHPPHTYWTNAYSFEPQYLETYGLRTRHILTTFPRWVPKFLHLRTTTEASSRNAADWFCIIVFWYFFLTGVIFAPFWCIPVCFTFCLVAISMSYRYGHHWIQPARFSSLFRRRLRVDVQSRRRQRRFRDGTYCESPAPTSSPSPCASAASSQANLPRPANTLSIDTSSPSHLSTRSSHSSSARHHQVSPSSSTHRYRRVYTGRGATRRHDEVLRGLPHEAVTRRSATAPNEVTDIKSPQMRSASYGRSSTGRTAEQPFVSVVDSPFGSLALTVHDPSSYCPRYPVFADDAGEQDIQEMLEHGLAVLDHVQIKFALNWEDPLLTLSSLFILTASTVGACGFLFVLSRLPTPIARLPLLTPLIIFIALTDPWYHKNLWLPVFGCDLPLLYESLLHRSHLLRRSTPKAEDGAEKLEDQQAQKSETLILQDTWSANESVGASRRWIAPQQSTGWHGLVQRWFTRRPSPTKPDAADANFQPDDLIAKHASPLALDAMTYTGNGVKGPDCQADTVSLSSSTRDSRRRFVKRSGLSPHVPVLGVLARVQSTASSWSIRSLKPQPTSVFGYCILQLSAGVLLVAQLFCEALRHCFLNPLWSGLFSIGLLMLQVVDIWSRLLWNWWIRLPDRREIEHRQIAATQYVETLRTLLPYSESHTPSLASHATFPGGSDDSERTERLDREVDLFLGDRFRQSSATKNPIAGLMNLRLPGNLASGQSDRASATTTAATIARRTNRATIPPSHGGRPASHSPLPKATFERLAYRIGTIPHAPRTSEIHHHHKQTNDGQNAVVAAPSVASPESALCHNDVPLIESRCDAASGHPDVHPTKPPDVVGQRLESTSSAPDDLMFKDLSGFSSDDFLSACDLIAEHKPSSLDVHLDHVFRSLEDHPATPSGLEQQHAVTAQDTMSAGETSHRLGWSETSSKGYFAVTDFWRQLRRRRGGQHED